MHRLILMIHYLCNIRPSLHAKITYAIMSFFVPTVTYGSVNFWCRCIFLT